MIQTWRHRNLTECSVLPGLEVGEEQYSSYSSSSSSTLSRAASRTAGGRIRGDDGRPPRVCPLSGPAGGGSATAGAAVGEPAVPAPPQVGLV